MLHPGPNAQLTTPRQISWPTYPETGRRSVSCGNTCATTLFCRGVNVKLVSEMLGHACVGITLRTYAHTMPGMHESAVAVLDAAFTAEVPEEEEEEESSQKRGTVRRIAAKR